MRLAGYDYAQPGAYFVTVCTAGRACILGEIVNGTANLSAFGRIVAQAWSDLARHYAGVELDQFVVMPNHVHGVLMLSADNAHPLSQIVGSFKSFSTRRIRTAGGDVARPVWQRGFYEHVIRTESDLASIREYITNNPIQWELDEENPRRAMRGL